MRRRDLLRAAALGVPGLAIGMPAFAFGEATQVDIAEIVLGPGTVSRPNAWKRLLYELVQTTSVECVARAVQVAPEDPELFEHPFAVLAGDDAFGRVSDEGVEQLARYLAYGGFLFVDDTTGSDQSGFDASARQLLQRLFPTRPLSPLPQDHSVFRSFFLIDRPVGRVDRFATLEGVTVGTLSPVVYCRNDLSGALDRGDDGRHAHACVPGGEMQRREAIKLGLNLVMYSMTADYKKDQAHVRELMREGRIE